MGLDRTAAGRARGRELGDAGPPAGFEEGLDGARAAAAGMGQLRWIFGAPAFRRSAGPATSRPLLRPSRSGGGRSR